MSSQRGVCVVRGSILQHDVCLAAETRNLKLVRSDKIGVDLIVNLPKVPSQAFLLCADPVGLLEEDADFTARFSSAASTFQTLYAVLPITLSARERILCLCTRLQLQHGVKVVWIAVDQSAAEAALDLALAAPELPARADGLFQQWQDHVSCWDTLSHTLRSIPLSSTDPDHLAPQSPPAPLPGLSDRQVQDLSVCGSLAQIIQASADDIAGTSGCSLPQAQALAAFFANTPGERGVTGC